MYMHMLYKREHEYICTQRLLVSHSLALPVYILTTGHSDHEQNSVRSDIRVYKTDIWTLWEGIYTLMCSVIYMYCHDLEIYMYPWFFGTDANLSLPSDVTVNVSEDGRNYTSYLQFSPYEFLPSRGAASIVYPCMHVAESPA